MEKNNKYEVLGTPFKIGDLEIKNRFVMGPMSMHWETSLDSGYTEDAVAFFTERAKGGFGAIITGGNSIFLEPLMGQYGLRSNPELFKAKAQPLLDGVHAYGTKIFQELSFGPGRNYPTFKAPSAVPVFNYPSMMSPALTHEEILGLRHDMIAAAEVVRETGFDGLSIHTLHWGYLLDEFVLSITNKRTDEYGGSLDNRLRLLRESVEGIHKACGDDFPIVIGLGVKSFIKALNKASLFGEDEAGRTVEEAIEIAKKLEEIGLAAITTDVGIYDSFYHAMPPSYMPHGHGVELYRKVKEAVSIPVLGRSRMGDPDVALHAVESGAVDAVVLARPSLADPEFPNKTIAGMPESIRPCIGCNMGCIARCLETHEHEGCAANPRACFELQFPEKKSTAPKKIAILGGGVAGMQAALTAVECGHSPEIFEISDYLGGELNAAGAHEDKKDIHTLRDWYIRELGEKKIPVHLNTELKPEKAKAEGFALAILATGASALMPDSIPGIEKALSAVDMLENGKDPGDTVVIVGGGMVGCECAVDLAKKGKKVKLVEALPAILSAEFVPQQHKMMLKDMMEAYQVEIFNGWKLAEVTEDGAVIEGARKMFTLGEKGEVSSVIQEGEKKALKADSVVMCIGLRPNESCAEAFEAAGIPAVEVGSAVRAGNVIDATRTAFETVYNLA